MGYRLYKGRDSWLIVPDCMVASQAAIQKHGPLGFVGIVEDDALRTAEIPLVTDALDATSFAKITKASAHRLMSRFRSSNKDAVRSEEQTRIIF